MKKLVSIMVLTLALGAFAFSQAGGGGGGGGGRGGQRGQRGGGAPMFDRSGAQYSYVGRSDVQAELKLTDDQKAKITQAGADRTTAMRAAFTDAGQDPAARTAALAKVTDEYNKTVGTVLDTLQNKRLMQIFVQMAKAQALENPDVQSGLGLSSDQVSKVKDLVAKERAASASLNAKVQSQEIDRAQAATDRAKNTETLNTDLMLVLTDEQKGKFKEMGGETFTPDPNIRGFGGGGGGGRRGGGAGGGGAAGGGN